MALIDLSAVEELRKNMVSENSAITGMANKMLSGMHALVEELEKCSGEFSTLVDVRYLDSVCPNWPKNNYIEGYEHVMASMYIGRVARIEITTAPVRMDRHWRDEPVFRFWFDSRHISHKRTFELLSGYENIYWGSIREPRDMFCDASQRTLWSGLQAYVGTARTEAILRQLGYEGQISDTAEILYKELCGQDYRMHQHAAHHFRLDEHHMERRTNPEMQLPAARNM